MDETDGHPSFPAVAQRSWQSSPPAILPFEPELLAAAAAFARDASAQRSAPLGNGQLARRLFGFDLFLSIGGFLGLGDGRFEREAHPLGLGIDIEHFALDFLSLLHDV